MSGPAPTRSWTSRVSATVRVLAKLLKDPEAVFEKMPYFSFKGDIELAKSDVFLADGSPIFLSRTRPYRGAGF